MKQSRMGKVILKIEDLVQIWTPIWLLQKYMKLQQFVEPHCSLLLELELELEPHYSLLLELELELELEPHCSLLLELEPHCSLLLELKQVCVWVGCV
jgi:hypothetical protein